MIQPAQQLQMPQKLKDAILSKTCVAFIGSGLSAGCYASWHELINGLCEQCGTGSRVSQNSTEDALLDAAQDAKTSNSTVYFRFLGEHFGRPAERASLLYDIILSLPFECYLTVNLDPLLALKARTAQLPCDCTVRAYPSLDRKAMVNRSIHYLHGIINEQSTPTDGTIVLARKEFELAYGNSSNLMNLLMPTLENDPIVFLGCRLREPVMPQVFAICRQHQQARKRIAMESGRHPGSPPHRFIFLPRPQVESEVNEEVTKEQSHAIFLKEDAYYRDMDIEPVWYSASKEDHSELRLALERLAGLPDIRPNYGWQGGSNAT